MTMLLLQTSKRRTAAVKMPQFISFRSATRFCRALSISWIVALPVSVVCYIATHVQEYEQELCRPVSAFRWPNLLQENNLAFSGKTKDEK
jgi:hypothetical protein